MKILITGINGMVASHLADLCLEKGDEVWGTYRWTEDDSNIKHIKDKINLIAMNLNDFGNVLKVIEQVKPDAISHLAAESYVGDSFDHPEESIRTNGIGTLNLLEAVRMVRDSNNNLVNWTADEPGSPYSNFDPVIHICSSSEVYGLVTPDLVPIKEECRFNPANPYACGKVLADVLANMYYTNYKLKTIRTRMFTHFSYRRKMLSAEVNFATQIAKIEAGKQPPVLWHGNLESVRTWADARDAVKAYYLILTEPAQFGTVYNIGGQTTKTIREMLNYLLDINNYGDGIIELRQDPKLLRPYDVTLQIPDCSKFMRHYPKWYPEITFEQSLIDLLNQKRKENGLEK